MSAPVRAEDRSDHDLLEFITETDLCRALQRPLPKDTVLAALSARAELIDRLVRWRWLASEQARATGITWTEIDHALHLPHGGARAEYHTVLSGQRRFGLVGPERTDPGPVGDRADVPSQEGDDR
jgi:hypothetical protein